MGAYLVTDIWMLFTYLVYFFLWRRKWVFCYPSDFGKYLMVYSKRKGGKWKSNQGSFSHPLSHSCLVIRWIGVGRSINISKILKCIKVKGCIVLLSLKEYEYKWHKNKSAWPMWLWNFFLSKWLQLVYGG